MENNQVLSNLYYLFSERYLEKLSKYQDVSSVNCGIHIGRISGDAKNCRISIINACNSDGEKNFQLLLEALVETIEDFPNKERNRITADLGVNIEDYKLGKKTDLQLHCESYASLTQHIDIQNFNIGTCYSPNDKYVDIKVINTGSAISNCGVEIVLNKLLKSNKSVPIDNKLSMNKFSVKWLVIYIVLCLCILIIMGYIYRTVRLKYIYGVYI
ncbi:lipid membrane protein [Finch poxvirus]|uniref:Lipid membrane protein n=1 Tax=Condorpox virus TaxID=3049970 RepID=A0AAT9UNQ1_9POXV|nr:lipid membrane protein [Finch poxvirus]UOX38998.1 lipid membrane protein [Finch poxvirus]